MIFSRRGMAFEKLAGLLFAVLVFVALLLILMNVGDLRDILFRFVDRLFPFL